MGSLGPGLLLPKNPRDLPSVLTWLEAGSWGGRCPPSHGLDRAATRPRHLPGTAAPLACGETAPRPVPPTMLCGVFRSLPTFRLMITSSRSFLGAGKGSEAGDTLRRLSPSTPQHCPSLPQASGLGARGRSTQTSLPWSQASNYAKQTSQIPQTHSRSIFLPERSRHSSPSDNPSPQHPPRPCTFCTLELGSELSVIGGPLPSLLPSPWGTP